MDHRQTEEGVPLQNQRRVTHPDKYAEELQWFSGFNRPEGLLHSPELDNLEAFKRLIWDNPSNTMIPEFNCYVHEMADLCCNGWVSTSHILWMMQKVSEAQDTCLCLCLPGDTPEIISQRIRRRRLANIQRLVFIINVGKLADSSVYMGTDLMGGSHWVMATVDMDGPTVLYCDSNAWGCPPDLLPVLSGFTALFGVPALPPGSLQLAHVPTKAGFYHRCSLEKSIHYPLQSCSDICGILCLVMMVTIATDPELFFQILQSRTDLYIHDPSRFCGFLRRIVISWFISGTPSTTFLRPVPDSADDYAYARKRKDDTRQGLTFSAKRQRTHPPETPHSPQRPSTSNHFGSAIPQPTSSQSPWRGLAKNQPPPPHPPSLGSSAGTQYSTPQPSSTNPPAPSPSSAQKKTKENVCPFCHKRLASRQSLSIHKKTMHAGQSILTDKVPNPICHCQTCGMSATCVRDLIFHYRNEHQRDHRILRGTFLSEEEFFEWKKETEQSSLTQFVKTCESQKSKDTVISYYYCHRSGVQSRKVTDRKRSQKSQGSCKSGHLCISYAIARKSILTDRVDVEYCLDHIGHKIQLCHLKISDEVRSTIAAKLAQGLEVGKILTEVRDKFTDVNRDTLLTRQDIHNIAKQLNISSAQRHANDKISVDLWVSELFSNVDHNPVIFYKSQGNQHESLKDEDILLCLQTQFQKEMLLKYHSKIICADSTHKTTQYDYFLTSLLVLDDHEEAIPVAWAISNHEDADVLKIFLDAVRGTCRQDLPTKVFMSDLAGNFYNAWCEVFSKPDKRLFCSWHVDKSWRRQVRSHVGVKEIQSLVYAYLKIIQSETNEAKFRKMLQEFFSYLSEEALDYFSRHYVYDQKEKLWAYCYRLGTIAS